MAPRGKLIRRKAISASAPRPSTDEPLNLVTYSDDENTVSEDPGLTKPSDDSDEEVSKETLAADVEESLEKEVSDDEDPTEEDPQETAVEGREVSPVVAEKEESSPSKETVQEVVEVSPPLSVLLPERSRSPDRKQKSLMVAEQKLSSKKDTSSVKLLSDAMKSGTVASRTRLKRKSPEVLSKSLTQPLGKKTKNSGILVPELSDFVSQEEIDYMLQDKKRPEYNVTDRQIAVSRRVDFRWFSANDLDIAPMFEVLGLKTFCESYGEASVEIIREFYANLIFYDGDSGPKFLKTSVGGKLLIFSTHDVNALYGVENHPPPPELDKNQAYSIILGHKVGVKNYLQSTKLSLKLRVLHRTVLFCLLPRSGSMDTITTKDAIVMAQLLKGIPINLGVLIFEHMGKCLAKSDKALPFGQVIADLLQKHNIDANTLSAKDKWTVGHFGSSTIHSMQYVQTPDGWKPKAEVVKPVKAEPISAISSRSTAKTKGHAAAKASTVPSIKASVSVEEGSTSSPLLTHIQELQRQVVAQGEDIRVLQRLVMDAIRIVERLEKLVQEHLEAPSAPAE